MQKTGFAIAPCKPASTAPDLKINNLCAKSCLISQSCAIFIRILEIQVNLFQKRFLPQLTLNMTKDCSLNHQYKWLWGTMRKNLPKTLDISKCS